MIVSFTGTRKGMGDSQHSRVLELVAEFAPTEVHHGDCVGADAEFAEIVGTCPLFKSEVVAHPGVPKHSGHRLYRANSKYNTQNLKEKPYLERNREMVDLLGPDDVLIAAPAPDSVGTEYTIDYGIKKGKKVVIVDTEGVVTRIGFN